MSKRRGQKKKSRQDAIYQVAIAGISAALALLFVWLGVVIRYSTVAFFIAAGVALMVPLTKRYYLSSIFAYVVSSALAFVVAGDIFTVVGYIAYFGPMCILTAVLYNKKVKLYFSVPIKILYINGALALLYFVCNTIVVDVSVLGEIPYWIIALVGTVALMLLDFMLQFIYGRLIPIIGKALRRNSKDNAPPLDGGSDDGEDDGDSTVFENQNSPFFENDDANGLLFLNGTDENKEVEEKSAAENVTDKNADDGQETGPEKGA